VVVIDLTLLPPADGIPRPDWSKLAAWLGGFNAADWRHVFVNLSDQQIWALAETMRYATKPTPRPKAA
jgi:hypothetical protein